MSELQVSHNGAKIKGFVPLESSKSESNRALIIQALSAGNTQLENVSRANDTQLLQRLLASSEKHINAEDAGTSYRFLTAYYAVKNGVGVLTGTERMKQRPIEKLVDALRLLGAKIIYLENEGYPPLEIIPCAKQLTNQLTIPAHISSQYISALLLVAPYLENGLKLTLEGKVASRPYINMTLSLMNAFGAETTWENDTIHVNPVPYQSGVFQVESDWSGASYWYAIVALAEEAEIELIGLKKTSTQGDSAIADIMYGLGVETEYKERSIVLRKKASNTSFEYDFSDCPDLAQTVIVVCAMKKIASKFSGLESLHIKETDRVHALQVELSKFGIRLYASGNAWALDGETPVFKPRTVIETYEDHRMAMALAPIALMHPVHIKDPEVVKKSYPTFWEHLSTVGFVITPEK